MEEPTALVLDDVMAANVATATIAAADVERLGKLAHTARGMAADAEHDLIRRERFLGEAIERAAAAAAEVASVEEQLRLDEAIAKATFHRLHAKEGLSYHHRHAVENAFDKADKGWELSLSLRERLVDAEASVRDACDMLTKAEHAMSVARVRDEKASQMYRWAQQESGLVSSSARRRRAAEKRLEEKHDEERAGTRGGGRAGGSAPFATAAAAPAARPGGAGRRRR